MEESLNNWKETGIVRGIQVKSLLPVEGNACYYGCGSDSYGYQIGKVADDGSSFEVLTDDGRLRGMAVLATNKRFRGCGYYFFADCDGKPSYYYSRGCWYGDITISNTHGCGKTYLDPNF